MTKEYEEMIAEGKTKWQLEGAIIKYAMNGVNHNGLLCKLLSGKINLNIYYEFRDKYPITKFELDIEKQIFNTPTILYNENFLWKIGLLQYNSLIDNPITNMLEVREIIRIRYVKNNRPFLKAGQGDREEGEDTVKFITKCVSGKHDLNVNCNCNIDEKEMLFKELLKEHQEFIRREELFKGDFRYGK